MNWINTLLLLLTAFLVVFLESAFTGVRSWLGAQVDLVPGLVVYASLSFPLPTVALLTIVGGLWFDSLSANPLGVSMLPLLVIALIIQHNRNLILRDQPAAQFVIGFCASAATPALTLLFLVTLGANPLLGWGTIWQWLVMSLGGAVCTPLFFLLFEWLDRTLSYRPLVTTSFRPDREIKRGRTYHVDH